jgi:putative membrane-bound dehydrogenase-like protein
MEFCPEAEVVRVLKRIPTARTFLKDNVMMHRSALPIAICLLSFTSTFGADGPLPPKEAAAAIKLPPGFKATLFAGEPDIVQPMSITFDDRGRLWVVECRSYPKWRPADAKEGADRILILEDADNDGTFDKKTVFLDKGVNLSSVEYGFGGVFVLSIPWLVFIPDANGDDVPDGPPQVLLDGFDLKAVHNVANGLTWGPDGWLYGCNGILSNSKIGKPGTPDDQRVPMNCGIWRFHPVRHEFEVVAHGTTNPWGLAFDERGEAFLTNCVIEHVFHVVPGARFKRMFGQDFNPFTFELMQTCADHIHWAGGTWEGSRNATGKHGEAGGGHAHSGAMVYLGDQFPDEYRNCLFTLNIHGQRLNVDKLERKQSGYVATHRPDFAPSSDPWFRGVCVKQGPDGSIYFTDWSDTGECHNYDDATIHRENGRIYKVTYGAAEATPKSPLLIFPHKVARSGEGASTLRGYMPLHGPVSVWLGEAAAKGQSDEADRNAIRSIATARPGTFPEQQLRVMWMCHITGVLKEEDHFSFVRSKEDLIRGWSIRLTLEDKAASPEMLAKLAELAKSDPSPYVRLQLASGLQRLPLADRKEIARGLVSHAEDAADNNLVLMIWYGIEPLIFVDESLRDSNLGRGATEVRSDDVLNLAVATKIPKLRQFIARKLASGKSPQLLTILRWIEESNDDVAVHRDVLNGLHTAIEGRHDLKPDANWNAIAPRLAMSGDATVRDLSQRISLIQGSDAAFGHFVNVVKNAKTAAAERDRALQALVATKRPAVADLLLDQLNDAALRAAAIRGLAGFDRDEVSGAILGRYAKLNDEEKLDAISTLTSREKTALALVIAVEGGTINKQDLSEFDIRQLQRFKEPKLKELVHKLFGAKPSSAERAKQIAEMKQKILAADASTSNASRGRALFTKNCATCHTLFGVGRQVGPDLTGAQRTDLDYVLVNVMDPSALVGHAYRVTVVALQDGRIISGIVKAEDDNTVTLETATDRVVVAKPDIEERQQQPVSMMPEGLLNRLTLQETRDLIEYLRSPNQVDVE